MTNLLEETKEGIKRSGHNISDIVFIGSTQSGHSCSWEQFKKLADIEYHSGYEVARDLVIIFNDGTNMWRSEYDGSEWWDYSVPLSLPVDKKPIKRLVGRYWPSLEDLQGEPDGHNIPIES